MRKLCAACVVTVVLAALFPLAAVAGDQGEERRLSRLGELVGRGPGAGARELSWVPGEVIVSYDTAADRNQVLARTGLSDTEPLSIPRTEVVDLEEGVSVADAVAELNATPGVRYAEPNYIYELRETVPNDPAFGWLWGLSNMGQPAAGVPGLAGADISMLRAWDTTTGSKDVLVAVVDDGIDPLHPDLAGNFVGGRDFGDGDLDPTHNPGDGHGSHVAGTIAAVGNNGTGITGVNWDASLLSYKVVDRRGRITNAAIVEAFVRAGERGARVVNASLGGPGIPFSMYSAVAEHPDTLYVVASGNAGQNNDRKADGPCDIWTLNLICVAASGPFDDFLDFSHFGPANVDLAAPGINVLSTQPFSVPLKTQIFDYPLFGRWITGGTSEWATEIPAEFGFGVLSDSPGGPYRPNTDSFVQVAQPIDLSVEQGCTLSWIMAVDTRQGHARVELEASVDGSTWTSLGSWGGFDIDTYTRDLGAYEGLDALHLRYRFVSDGRANSTFTGVYLTDHKVVCAGTTAYGDQHYDFLVGTSMASPHVAGAAALLFAARPSATVEQVRWALLESVDPMTGARGKTATEGRLNVAAALDRLAVAPANPYPQRTTRHSRTIKGDIVRFGGKLEAFGRLRPDDGHWACSLYVPILVQRKVDRGWKHVVTTAASPSGEFYVRFKDRPGPHRLKAPGGFWDEERTIFCRPAVS